MIADVAAQTEHVTRDTVVPPNSLRRYVRIRAGGPTVLPIIMELMVSAKAVRCGSAADGMRRCGLG